MAERRSATVNMVIPMAKAVPEEPSASVNSCFSVAEAKVARKMPEETTTTDKTWAME